MMTAETYAEAYRTGFPGTIRLLVCKGLHIEEAEEVAQSAWVRGWEAKHQLRNANRVAPWVNTIAMNTMFNRKRRAKWTQPLHELTLSDSRNRPATARIDAERLLARCSVLDRTLLLNRYEGGMEMDEIARLHGMTGVAARVRIHRARKALRSFIGWKGCQEAVPA
ncbi:MAG: sigma-70 family RNA polymerase sigma factor [Bryobacterales bacterium]|nr:sigma-70 family RNA polymerase sigma factor [Bryobacterales bacterium]